MTAKKSEKYFICHECGEVSTWTEQMDDAGSGGTGLCACMFRDWNWSEKFNDIDVWFPREYVNWTEISKKWYEMFKHEKNHVLRLRMLAVIPPDALLNKEVK